MVASDLSRRTYTILSTAGLRLPMQTPHQLSDALLDSQKLRPVQTNPALALGCTSGFSKVGPWSDNSRIRFRFRPSLQRLASHLKLTYVNRPRVPGEDSMLIRKELLCVQNPFDRPIDRLRVGWLLGGVPREQNMLTGHLPGVIYHHVYQHTKFTREPEAAQWNIAGLKGNRKALVDRLRWVGYHESRRCSRDTYPESYNQVY